MLVESWRSPKTGQKQRPSSLNSTNSDDCHPNPGHLQHLSLTYNQVDKLSNGHSNHSPHCKLLDFDENSRTTSSTYRSRLESDPIDRGVMPADALHGKVESLENCLDEIYRKMKSDLRDVRDSIKVLSRHSVESSSTTSPLPPMGSKNNMYHFRYPQAKADHINVWRDTRRQVFSDQYILWKFLFSEARHHKILIKPPSLWENVLRYINFSRLVRVENEVIWLPLVRKI